MPDERRQTLMLYAGVLAVALAVLMHEILLVRILSVTLFHDLAFIGISLALFGSAVGGVLVQLRPERYGEQTATSELVKHSLGYAQASVAGLVLALQVPFGGATSVAGILELFTIYALVCAPFVFAGATLAIALTKFTAHVHELYAADLLGAALGCLLVIGVVELTDALTAFVAAAALASAGALLFAWDPRATPLRARALATFGVLTLLAVGNATLLDASGPILRVRTAHGLPDEGLHYVRWNVFSRVQVTGNPFVRSQAAGWGLSHKTGAAEAMAQQMMLGIDVATSSVITYFTGDTRPLDFLKDDVTNVAHALRPHSDVLILGVGGGRDVLSALVFGQPSVTAVEVNDEVLDAINVKYGDFTGHLDRDPRVTFIHDDARSFVSGTTRSFGIIEMSFTDTQAASAVGPLLRPENALYTVEAWRALLERLAPRGVLSVSRFYLSGRPDEMLRLTALARAALDRIGVPTPKNHVLLVKASRASGPAGDFGLGVGTLLVGRDPFTTDDLTALESETRRLGFDLVLTPSRSEEPILDAILSSPDTAALYRSLPRDVSPPTDDRPFFLQMLWFRDFPKAFRISQFDPNRSNLEAVGLVGALLVLFVLLCVAAVAATLAAARRAAPASGSVPALLVFFTTTGLGFMLVEVSDLHRLGMLLGHPERAISVVLFTLLAASAAGSLAAARLVPQRGRARPTLLLAVAVVVLFAHALLTPRVASVLARASSAEKIAAVVALLAPAGLAMGASFPLGMRVATVRAPVVAPWLWAMNALACVVGYIAASALALSFGISVACFSGVACYAVCTLAYWAATSALEARLVPRE